MFDRVGTNRGQRIDNSWTRTGKAGVNQHLTVSTWKDGDISAGAHEDAHVAAKFLNRECTRCGCPPSSLHKSVILGKELSWSHEGDAKSFAEARKLRREI